MSTTPSLESRLTSSHPTIEATEADLADQQERFMGYDEVKSMPAADRDALFTLLRKAHGGDPSALETVMSFAYEERPVPIDEFVLGKRYLNLRGLINQEKLDILARIDHPRVRHTFLACGSGAGKSFIVSIVNSRVVYKLLCLRRPDLFYMLGPGSGIACVNLSVSKEQARDVVYAELKARMEHSPWFQRRYMAYKYHATFAKKIAVFCQSKNPTVSYGYNTFFSSLDECSWMVDNDERSLAEDLYEAVQKSMNSRFPGAYKFMAISTLRDTSDFLNTEIERIKKTGFRVVI
jgi:hypothetical protein